MKTSGKEVEFENLPTLCFECGRVGHEAAGCSFTQTSVPEPNQTSKAFDLHRNGPQVAIIANNPPNRPDFGPWLTVERKSWKQKKEIQISNCILRDWGDLFPPRMNISATTPTGPALPITVPMEVQTQQQESHEMPSTLSHIASLSSSRFHRRPNSQKKVSHSQQALRDISAVSSKLQLQLHGKKQSQKLISAVNLTGLEEMFSSGNPSVPPFLLTPVDTVMNTEDTEATWHKDVGHFDLNTKVADCAARTDEDFLRSASSEA
ncbi:hypothetical protein LINGRAHAP2_LOCUS35242 [Linum grandiflorum]